MKVAVTGAAGFLGVNLLSELTASGDHVAAIDIGRPEWVDIDRVQWVAGDVLDPDSMRAALSGAEVVYHLAGSITLHQHDASAWQLNTAGVATVARACLDAGVRRMVHCSTVHAYDETRCGPVLSETAPRAVGPHIAMYGRSKYAGEQELHRVIDDGLDAVICNPTGIYGPIDNPARLSRLNTLVRDGALGRAPASVAGGFDFVDVRDAARGLRLAAEFGRTGENYLLPGEMVSIHDLLTAAAHIAGRRGPMAAVPLETVRAILPLAQPISDALGSDVMSRAAVEALLAARPVDGSKARAELGYRARPFEETIRDLVAYLVQSGVLMRKGWWRRRWLRSRARRPDIYEPAEPRVA